MARNELWIYIKKKKSVISIDRAFSNFSRQQELSSSRSNESSIGVFRSFFFFLFLTIIVNNSLRSISLVFSWKSFWLIKRRYLLLRQPTDEKHRQILDYTITNNRSENPSRCNKSLNNNSRAEWLTVLVSSRQARRPRD